MLVLGIIIITFLVFGLVAAVKRQRDYDYDTIRIKSFKITSKNNL